MKQSKQYIDTTPDRCMRSKDPISLNCLTQFLILTSSIFLSNLIKASRASYYPEEYKFNWGGGDSFSIILCLYNNQQDVVFDLKVHY